MKRKTRRFWKVLRQINTYVSNKWLLKFPCAYLNTQESRHTGTPLIRIQDGGIHSLCALLFNISSFWATRFSFIFGPFRFQMGIKSSIY
ncbi:hypothetical protein T03_4104 [Trichinella britovi]|uniref:Uncharacterized protein n=1 Tax=Trichinella britovi TaxID=45882 RepID=A0A0V1CP83_TRIBR|nr:hypothetical protein T03_4104 [Trichinella britovi]